jgi:hypothetical protein
VTKPLTVRSACAVAVTFVAMGAVGCGQAKKDRPDTGVAAAGATASAPATASAAPSVAAAVVAAQPGALPKPIDQMTGDELYAFTHGLTFTGGVERQRRCRGEAACRGPNPTRFTRLRIDAVGGEDSLTTGAGLSPNGTIAVRGLNRGQLADSMYDMRPGKPYEFYLIVLPGPQGGNATWRLEELTTTAGSRSHRSIMTGAFKGCNHPFVRGARADFKTCAQAAPVRQASFGAALQTEIDPPIWISCAAGCCTSDPPDGHT